MNVLTYEEKERRKIENMRRREQDRLNRFFDSKQRMIGIDKDSIEKQIEEKNKIKEREKQRNDYFEDQMSFLDKMAIQQQKKIEQQRKERLQQMNDYRMKNQRTHQRREWDLNDPERFIKQPVQRVHDFHGEDVKKKEREELQKKQQREWISAQNNEKALLEERKRLEEQAYQMEFKKMTELSKKAEEEQKQLRLERQRQINEFNQELQRAKEAKEMEQREKDYNLEQIALKNSVESNLLTERYSSTLSNTRKNSYIPYNFKGYDQEKLKQIQEERERQIIEKNQREQKEKDLKNAFETYSARNNKLSILKERELERKRRERNAELCKIHDKQKEQASLKKKRLNQLYEGEIEESFFDKFGRNSR